MLKKTILLITTLFLLSCNIERSTIKVSYKMPSDVLDTAILSTPTISLLESDYVFYNNEAISDIDPMITGSQVSFSISPGLPTGLSLNTSTGKISGTPANISARTQYTITAANSKGSAQVQFYLTIGNYFAVNSTADASDTNIGDGVCSTVSSVCTLRAAIEELNAGTLLAKINLPAGTIVIGSELVPTKSLSLVGAGITQTILSGNNTNRIFNIATTSASMTLKDLKITSGYSDERGGAVSFFGKNLVIDNVDISDSHSISEDDGGGALYFQGLSLTANNCSFKNNSRISTGGSNIGGGAVQLRSGQSTFESCVFENNVDYSYGGAVHNIIGSEVSFDRCTFLNNQTQHGAGDGGAVHSNYKTIVKRSYFQGNSAGATMGTGGAIYLGFSSDNNIIENSTFYDNRALGWGSGGAIYIDSNHSGRSDATLMRNNTIFGNSSGSGGGIYTGNSWAYIIFQNNIIASNTGGNCTLSGTIFTDGGNIDSANTCSFNDATDLINTNPNFLTGTPQNNGGSTLTLAIDNMSPAFDSAVAANCPTVDQINQSRIINQCDRGAFEAQ